MNHSRYLTDARRSPYPRRRRRLEPRSPDLAKSLPAITLLHPDSYHLQQSMSPRPLSPGAFRIAPPRSAKNKMTSFVILNEHINSPVTSRAPSPSGRVSPFRGHGFKSPTSSRPASRAVSPLPSPTRRKNVIVPVEKVKIIHQDIGLPPKSPKKVLKSTQIKEFKPPIKPKPILTNGKVVTKANGVAPKQVKVVSAKKTMMMSTVNEKKDKKPPVAPPKKEGKQVKKKEDNAEKVEPMKSTDPEDPVIVSVKEKEEKTLDSKNNEKEERLIPCFQPDKCCVVPPTMASPSQMATSTTTVPSGTPTTNKVSSSRISAITSALSVTDALSKKSLQPKVNEKPKSPRSPHLEDAKTKLALITASSPAKVETAVATMTTVDEIIKSRIGSAASQRSNTQLSLGSPTPSEKTRSSMVTVRAASNASLRSNGASKLNVEHVDTGETISTTKIIRADPDVEVLSPNNLLRSPPDGMREPLFEGERVANGNAPSPVDSQPKGRCRRFSSALWRLITYIFCCCKRLTCSLPSFCRCACCSRCRSKFCRCRRTPTPSSGKPSCCPKCNPCSIFRTCFQKLNCCKNLKCSSCCKGASCCQSGCCQKPFCKKCSCGKLKCCEGKKCCKRTKNSKQTSTTMCCAKPSCSCKECCGKLKNCCSSCGDKINSFCRSFFCLNLACCTRCLKKCTCCHKMKCCKKGGCCSCCNPHVKREQKRLDKKTSRASNQSKQERALLDPALVDHASVMKAAIPVLPACLAWFCLILNFLIPGSGTLLSGILCLCFGKPRFSTKDSPQSRCGSFLVNIVIAISQAFTIIFCLVGWGWSMWWGVIMVKLARKQKRLALAEKNQEASGPAHENHVDPGRMV